MVGFFVVLGEAGVERKPFPGGFDEPASDVIGDAHFFGITNEEQLAADGHFGEDDACFSICAVGLFRDLFDGEVGEQLALGVKERPVNGGALRGGHSVPYSFENRVQGSYFGQSS